MLSLLKTGAPEAVEVDGVFYPIHTDFRFWIRFSKMLKEKHTYGEYNFLYTTTPPGDLQKGFEALLDFYLDKHELPKVHGSGSRKRAFDYELDADLFYSAFLEVYGIDLTEVKLHWHKFQALFTGLHGTKLNEVIGYRLYDENDKKEYKQAMIENRNMWALPEEYTAEEQEALDAFDSQIK